MSILDSISRSIKNVFVGSHKGDDFKYDPPEGEYLPEVDWFENPLDKMPIANGTNRYAPPEKLAELEAMETNPRPEEDMSEWFTDEEDGQDYEGSGVEEDKTVHQKMYEIATAKYNPFSIGGSESITDFGGGSEEAQK